MLKKRLFGGVTAFILMIQFIFSGFSPFASACICSQSNLRARPAFQRDGGIVDAFKENRKDKNSLISSPVSALRVPLSLHPNRGYSIEGVLDRGGNGFSLNQDFSARSELETEISSEILKFLNSRSWSGNGAKLSREEEKDLERFFSARTNLKPNQIRNFIQQISGLLLTEKDFSLHFISRSGAQEKAVKALARTVVNKIINNQLKEINGYNTVYFSNNNYFPVAEAALFVQNGQTQNLKQMLEGFSSRELERLGLRIVFDLPYAYNVDFTNKASVRECLQKIKTAVSEIRQALNSVNGSGKYIIPLDYMCCGRESEIFLKEDLGLMVILGDTISGIHRHFSAEELDKIPAYISSFQKKIAVYGKTIHLSLPIQVEENKDLDYNELADILEAADQAENVELTVSAPKLVPVSLALNDLHLEKDGGRSQYTEKFSENKLKAYFNRRSGSLFSAEEIARAGNMEIKDVPQVILNLVAPQIGYPEYVITGINTETGKFRIFRQPASLQSDSSFAETPEQRRDRYETILNSVFLPAQTGLSLKDGGFDKTVAILGGTGDIGKGFTTRLVLGPEGEEDGADVLIGTRNPDKLAKIKDKKGNDLKLSPDIRSKEDVFKWAEKEGIDIDDTSVITAREEVELWAETQGLPLDRISVLSNNDIVKKSRFVILGVNWNFALSTIDDIFDDLKEDAILVCPAVPLDMSGGPKQADISLPEGYSSAAEMVQEKIDILNKKEGKHVKVVSVLHNIHHAILKDHACPLCNDVVIMGNDVEAKEDVADMVRQMSRLKPVILGGLEDSRYVEMITPLDIRMGQQTIAMANAEAGFGLKDLVIAMKEKGRILTNEEVLEIEKKTVDMSLLKAKYEQAGESASPIYARFVKHWEKFLFDNENNDSIENRGEIMTVNIPENDLKVNVKIGTSGWRTIMQRVFALEQASGKIDQVEFTLDNTGRFARAVSEVMQNAQPGKLKFAVTYDGRKGSRDFARHMIEVFAAYGIDSVISSDFVTTPAAIALSRDYDLVLHITASHNDVRYNGVKILKSGVVAPDSLTKQFQDRANALDENGQRIISSYRKKYLDTVKKVDVAAMTLARYQKTFPGLEQEIKKYLDETGTEITLDLLHGSAGPFVSFFKNIGAKVIRETPMSEGTYPQDIFEEEGEKKLFRPEPVELFLDKQAFTAFKEQAPAGSLYLGIDGDGDRLAAWVKMSDSTIRDLTPNELGVLYGWYLSSSGRTKGRDVICKTLPTTKGMDALAEWGHKNLVVTPVGSKHFAPYVLDKTIFIGTEESGHQVVTIGDETWFDDAASQAMLLLEIMTASRKDLAENIALAKTDIDFQGVYKRVSKDLTKEIKAGITGPLEQDISGFADQIISSVGKQAAKVSVTTTEGKVVSLQELLEQGLELNVNEGMHIEFSDKSWVQIRLSGTEDVMRNYNEASTEPERELLADSVFKAVGIKDGGSISGEFDNQEVQDLALVYADSPASLLYNQFKQADDPVELRALALALGRKNPNEVSAEFSLFTLRKFYENHPEIEKKEIVTDAMAFLPEVILFSQLDGGEAQKFINIAVSSDDTQEVISAVRALSEFKTARTQHVLADLYVHHSDFRVREAAKTALAKVSQRDAVRDISALKTAAVSADKDFFTLFFSKKFENFARSLKQLDPDKAVKGALLVEAEALVKNPGIVSALEKIKENNSELYIAVFSGSRQKNKYLLAVNELYADSRIFNTVSSLDAESAVKSLVESGIDWDRISVIKHQLDASQNNADGYLNRMKEEHPGFDVVAACFDGPQAAGNTVSNPVLLVSRAVTAIYKDRAKVRSAFKTVTEEAETRGEISAQEKEALDALGNIRIPLSKVSEEICQKQKEYQLAMDEIADKI